MNYFTDGTHTFCCDESNLPFAPCASLPAEGEILYLFRAPALAGRETFAVSDGGVMTPRQDERLLSTLETPAKALPPELAAAVAAGRVRGVNLEHPRFRELLPPLGRPEKYRLHLLALGDVGSTLLQGLRLLGGDVLSAIGICDVRPEAAKRWEFELNQISLPWDYDALPPVEIVETERLFDCDVFLFCASRHVPDVSVKSGDVRMAQLAANAPLVASYAKMAREKGYQGKFWVVSDPVDPLCKAALLASSRNEQGEVDGKGLLPGQIRGFGLGVMNARAAYYAKKDPRFADFLTDGRTFGPHGEDLVVANSVSRYDDALSRELTERVAHANLEMRALGFKPFVAPALSSGALSVLLALRGQWHCSSVYLGGVFMGCKNRDAKNGPEIERLKLPEALMARIRETADRLRAVEV
ncbi:MAG: lactate dehydrogenase [Oscillospiraceae bacterium]